MESEASIALEASEASTASGEALEAFDALEAFKVVPLARAGGESRGIAHDAVADTRHFQSATDAVSSRSGDRHGASSAATLPQRTPVYALSLS